MVFEIAGRLGEGRLDFVMPDGRRFRAEGKGPGVAAEIEVRHDDLFARLVREGDLGFCDAYLDGWWTTPDLQAFLDLIQRPVNNIVGDSFPGMSLERAYERLRFWMQSNTRRQPRKNIAYHYDLGNDFYQLWLDETMTYSSALFETGQESLDAAQSRKYASLIDRGVTAAKAFVRRHVLPKDIEASSGNDTEKDSKTALLHWCQHHKLGQPRYELKETLGLQHEQQFRVVARLLDGRSEESQGRTKRAAEKGAAELLLERLRRDRS